MNAGQAETCESISDNRSGFYDNKVGFPYFGLGPLGFGLGTWVGRLQYLDIFNMLSNPFKNQESSRDRARGPRMRFHQMQM